MFGYGIFQAKNWRCDKDNLGLDGIGVRTSDSVFKPAKGVSLFTRIISSSSYLPYSSISG
jgi:hypothetical protein